MRILLRWEHDEVVAVAEVPRVIHRDWEYYDFELDITETLYGIAFMPIYLSRAPYNGSVLIDDVSLIAID